MSKRIAVTAALTALLLASMACALTLGQPASSGQAVATQSYLTPAALDALKGKPIAAAAGDWLPYDDPALGLHVLYPPDWTAIPLEGEAGVGFYPPGSSPDLPGPSILIRYLHEPYHAGQPRHRPGSAIMRVRVSGIDGQLYQDDSFSIPDENVYVELPYGDGMLLVQGPFGPSIDLSPQLNEMLHNLQLAGLR